MAENRFDPALGHWVALRTPAHWEKKIATMLEGARVPVFLPSMTRVVQYATKRSSSEVPLFSGYVFAREHEFIGNPAVPAACRKQIAQVLRPSDPHKLAAELTHIASLLEDHRLIQERLYGQPGERVLIRSGSFAGQEGTILSLKPGKHLLVVEVSFLGCRLEIEIEEHLVKKQP